VVDDVGLNTESLREVEIVDETIAGAESLVFPAELDLLTFEALMSDDGNPGRMYITRRALADAPVGRGTVATAFEVGSYERNSHNHQHPFTCSIWQVACR
jgi:hypothetical protein